MTSRPYLISNSPSFIHTHSISTYIYIFFFTFKRHLLIFLLHTLSVASSNSGNASIWCTDTLKSISEGCQRRQTDGWIWRGRQRWRCRGCVESSGHTPTALSNGCHYCATPPSLPILILSRPNLYAAAVIVTQRC